MINRIAPTKPRYPLDDQPGGQFTASLTTDVAAVLARHGFPTVEGSDLHELAYSLHDFIYGGEA